MNDSLAAIFALGYALFLIVLCSALVAALYFVSRDLFLLFADVGGLQF